MAIMKYTENLLNTKLTKQSHQQSQTMAHFRSRLKNIDEQMKSALIGQNKLQRKNSGNHIDKRQGSSTRWERSEISILHRE